MVSMAERAARTFGSVSDRPPYAIAVAITASAAFIYVNSVQFGVRLQLCYVMPIVIYDCCHKMRTHVRQTLTHAQLPAAPRPCAIDSC